MVGMVIKLSDVLIKEGATIFAIEGETSFRDRIQSLGFTPGCRVKLLHQSLFNGPLALEVRDTKIALRKQDAQHILVHSMS